MINNKLCTNSSSIYILVTNVIQDFSLAERNYDSAVEVNPNIQVPVSLALAKLRVRQFWASSLQSASETDLYTLGSHLAVQVDQVADLEIVAMAMLFGLLVYLVKLRERWYRTTPPN